MEIVYLEGNHDYNLKSIFPNINVIKEKSTTFAKLENNQTVVYPMEIIL